MPVSGFRGRVGSFFSYEGGISLDRLLKRYVIIEFLLGVAVIALGFFFQGVMLFALGTCMIALAAQCSVYSEKHHWAVIALGLFSLLGLAASGLSSFFHMTSVSRYANDTSPLTVLLVLTVIILVQSFLLLPLEDRPDLDFLRRGVSRMAIFGLIGFAAIVLTYVLSYFLYGSLVSALVEGDGMMDLHYQEQDFHYLEGALALSMALTSVRGVLRSFLGRERLSAGSEGGF